MTDAEFLNIRRLPARLQQWQVAVLLGFSESSISILISLGLLRPIGKPPENAPKFFWKQHIEDAAHDERWLAKASDGLVAHWANSNARKRRKKIPQQHEEQADLKSSRLAPSSGFSSRLSKARHRGMLSRGS